MTFDSNPGFSSNKPTHYLLDHGDFTDLDTEFKFSKQSLPSVLNLDLLRAGSLQFLHIATYSAIVRLGFVPNPRQRPNLAVTHDKTYNILKSRRALVDSVFAY